MRRLLQAGLALALLLPGFTEAYGPAATIDDVYANGVGLVAGNAYACVLEITGVKCFGAGWMDQLDVPALKSPTQLAAGGDASCAIDYPDVECWGIGMSPGGDKTEVPKPELSDPTAITVGANHACVIDGGTVKCWGTNDHGQCSVPKLSRPRAIAAGYQYSCALDDAGVKCWGDRDLGDIFPKPPTLNSPKTLVSGFSNICVIDEDGLQCWGNSIEGQPELSHPTSVAMGLWNTCAIDDSGVHCWGEKKYHVNDVPKLSHPREVAVGETFACALDYRGIHCWGDLKEDNSNMTPPAELADLNPYFSVANPLESLVYNLGFVHNFFYRYKSDFLTEVASNLWNLPGSQTTHVDYWPHLFTLNVIAPLFNDPMAPREIRERVLPNYKRALAQANRRARVSNLSNIPLDPGVLKTSLQISISALKASRDFLADPRQHSELEGFLGVLSSYQYGNPSTLYRSHEALLQSLSRRVRTAPFGLILLEIKRYLEGKI